MPTAGPRQSHAKRKGGLQERRQGPISPRPSHGASVGSARLNAIPYATAWTVTSPIENASVRSSSDTTGDFDERARGMRPAHRHDTALQRLRIGSARRCCASRELDDVDDIVSEAQTLAFTDDQLRSLIAGRGTGFLRLPACGVPGTPAAARRIGFFGAAAQLIRHPGPAANVVELSMQRAGNDGL